MNKLLTPNRDGGYPLTGEALSILGADIPAYINAILEQITPDNSVVFLSDDYAYVKWSGYKEIMLYTLTGRTQAQLKAGAKSLSAVTETIYSDTVNGITYANTRCSRVIAVSSSTNVQLDAPIFYDFESLLNKKVDYLTSLTAMSFSIRNIFMTGHAIIKGGVADISIVFWFEGNGAITVDLPDEFACYGIVSTAYQNTNANAILYPQAKIVGTTLSLNVTADNASGGYVSVHFHYMPIAPTPL